MSYITPCLNKTSCIWESNVGCITLTTPSHIPYLILSGLKSRRMYIGVGGGIMTFEFCVGLKTSRGVPCEFPLVQVEL